MKQTFIDWSREALGPLAQQVEGALSRDLSLYVEQLEGLKILQGRALARANAARAPFKGLRDAEFKVFSQFGEDGILQHLIRETGIRREEETFIEFGVQHYMESNTRFLLMNDNWRGLIMDGSEASMRFVQSLDLYWRHDLTALHAWIDRDNIDTLIRDAGFAGDLGILSIDIDGNDYWVWERIEAVNPVIVVAEYNSLFGASHAVTVPYDPGFDSARAHASGLYWGASIRALAGLAERRGYALVGSNHAGNNAFFVRRDRLGRLEAVSAQDAHVDARFRISRNTAGQLDFIGLEARRQAIRDLPLVVVPDGSTTTLAALGGGTTR